MLSGFLAHLRDFLDDPLVQLLLPDEGFFSADLLALDPLTYLLLTGRELLIALRRDKEVGRLG